MRALITLRTGECLVSLLDVLPDDFGPLPRVTSRDEGVRIRRLLDGAPSVRERLLRTGEQRLSPGGHAHGRIRIRADPHLGGSPSGRIRPGAGLHRGRSASGPVCVGVDLRRGGTARARDAAAVGRRAVSSS
ncbi:hypothetical protein J5Y04_15320 [Kitasatospora sp. RG8]|uniref:hypothetical protein n=1 Tax=Kitasatospora sp. RG8 TaxID=2820815 RepID=UPI001AE08785|nr:hypothetical protein [Kitasatospora sp. RG8]MBP0450905.1 hypothetical protein [Kitasatospora sp. RG8]